MTSTPLLHRSFRHLGSYLGLTFLAASQSGLKAAPLYWDLDNAAVYSGSATPSGIWNATNANWSTNALGLPGTNTTFATGSDVVFSSGTDATGTYTVTVGTGFAPSLTSIDFQEGHVNIAPTVDINAATAPNATTVEAITLTGTPTVNVQNMNSTISTRILGGAGLTKNGYGQLSLDYGKVGGTYFDLGSARALTVNAGTLEIKGSTSGDQLSVGSIVVNSGATFLYSATNSISNGTVLRANLGGTIAVSNISDLVANLAGDGLVYMRGGTLNFAPQNTTDVFSGLLTGTGAISVQNSNGSVILSGANTLRGSTGLTTGVTGNDTTGNPLGSSATGSIRLAHKRALQNSTILQRNTSGPGLTFDSTQSDTFIVGGLTSIAISGGITQQIHDNTKAINLEGLNGSAITLQAGNNDSSTSYSGKLTGSGGLTKIGTGTLSVTGHYNVSTTTYTGLAYTGDTTVNSGAHNSGTTAVDNTNVGTLNLDFSTAYAPAANIISSESRLVLGGGRLLVTGKNNASASQTFDGTLLQNGHSYVQAAPGATSSNVTINLGAITRNKGATVEFIGGAGSTFTTSNANSNGILGPWSFYGTTWAMKNTSGNIVAYDKVSNYTSQTDGLLANDGTQNVEVLTNTGTITTAANITTSLNTLQISDTTNDRTLTIGTNGVLSTNAIWYNGSAARMLTISGGTITAGAGTDSNAELVLNSGAGTFRIDSAITDNSATGSVALVKTGRGQIHLYGNNSYSGGLLVQHGRVNVNHANALGTGTVTVNPGGQVFFALAGTYLNNFTISGYGWGEGAGPGALRVQGGTIGNSSSSITLEGDARIGTNNGTFTVAGKITGDHGIDFSNGGSGVSVITLNNSNNDFNGNFTINSSPNTAAAFNTTPSSSITIKLGAANVLPDGTGKGNVILTGGAGSVTLDLNGFSETINALNSSATHANTFITNNGAADATLALGNNNASSIYAPSTSTNDISVFFGGVIRDGTSSGNIRKVAITKIGEGTQTFAGLNTYSGATNLNKGTLKAGAANTFSANSAITIADDPTAILDLADYSQTIKSLSGRGTVNLGTAALTPSVGAVLTTGDDTNTTFEGAIVGAGGIKKQGTGTFTITGTNTYLATTQVSAGNLQVGRSNVGQTGSGAVTVDLSGTLSGTGNVRGVTTITGSLRPGDNGGADRGTLTFADATASSLILSAGSNTYLTLGGATGNEANPLDGIQTSTLLSGTPGAHDHLDINGSLTLNGGSTINVSLLSGFNPVFGDVYNLVDWGIVNGSLTNNGFNVGTDLVLETSAQMITNGLSWDRSQFLSHGIVFVVPEPGRALLLVLGFAFVFLRRRR